MSVNKIYLQIAGNCGNQFFQYAFARSLQEKLGGELYIDYSYVLHDKDAARLGSEDLLREFNTVQYIDTDNRLVREFSFQRKLIQYIESKIRKKRLEIGSYAKYCYIKKWSQFLEIIGICYFLDSYREFNIPKWCKKIYIQGYFESPKYFEDINASIVKELFPKNELLDKNRNLKDIIDRTESVCVSIKRMDLDVDDIADMYAYDIRYYYGAVEYFNNHIEHPVYVIFSDDVSWCKENFKIEGEVYYEESDNPMWEKIRLMSACKYFVIRNSTFSWWVQHLSTREGKKTIAPCQWLNKEQPIDIYEDGWIYMDDAGNLMPNHL